MSRFWRLGIPWNLSLGHWSFLTGFGYARGRFIRRGNMNNARLKLWIRWLLIGLAAVAGLAAALVLAEREERRFNSEMNRLVHLRFWDPQAMTRAETMAIREAGLRRLGPQAGRWLLEKVYDEPSKLAGIWERFRKSAFALLRRSPPAANPKFPGVDEPNALWSQGELAQALASVGQPGRISTHHLLHLAGQRGLGVREAALELLGGNGDASPAVIAALTQHASGSMPTRVAAAIALHRLQPTNSVAVDNANNCLADLEGAFEAVETLRRLGPAAKPFVPGLKRALAKFQADLSDSPRQAARIGMAHAVAVALWKIEGTPHGALIWLQHARRLRAATQNGLHANIEGELVDLARDLADSTEFCRAVLPVLQEIKPRPGPALADALRQIDQTLGTVANAASAEVQNSKDQ